MRGTLREYQHIGLDWLVAMDQKKLNGRSGVIIWGVLEVLLTEPRLEKDVNLSSELSLLFQVLTRLPPRYLSR